MRVVLLLALMVGCSTKPNPKSCADSHCSDPELPFCDVDGSIGGEPNTCISVDCIPNTFEECRGDRALTCNAAGDSYDLVQCEFGCGPDGCVACDQPECEKKIAPKFLPTTCTESATHPEFTLTMNRTLDTNEDLNCSSIMTQPTGPEICVLRYTNIAINSNQTLTVIGDRALALVADYTLDVKGIVDVSANASTNGPGGGILKSGSTADVVGGGGAGYRTVGGAGGNSSADGGAANGGPAADSPVLVSELFGGRQAVQQFGHRLPGGAGGAIALISCRGKLSVSGLIDAGGGGGARGDGYYMPPSGNYYYSAAGGGTGGTVVLQGIEVELTGQIFANGGGGGGGQGIILSGTSPALPGQDGQRSTTRAKGGVGAGNGAGAGGDGGTSLPPTNGRQSDNAGAGGGSAGFIVVFTPEFVFPTGTPVAISPPLEPKQTIATN